MKISTRIGLVMAAGMFLAGCATSQSAWQEACAAYQAQRDYASLEVVGRHLAPGVPQTEVERCLGEPDYSPTDGLYYYSSTRNASAGPQGGKVPYGLIVDYRDGKGTVTQTLRRLELGPIAE